MLADKVPVQPVLTSNRTADWDGGFPCGFRVGDEPPQTTGGDQAFPLCQLHGRMTWLEKLSLPAAISNWPIPSYNGRGGI
ncbi:hypothetical protein BaRGS_00000274 [Batillaria attramentaria]|uniref:Uncharacterized protein n=1 Tax=Batillaria attramentaria TaxID=370345 RepID=A0ABD0MBT7_9CAEN